MRQYLDNILSIDTYETCFLPNCLWIGRCRIITYHLTPNALKTLTKLMPLFKYKKTIKTAYLHKIVCGGLLS